MTWKQRASIGLLLLGHFACVAFCTPVAMFSLFVLSLVVGVVFGQTILIATWLILSNQARLFRFTSGGLLAASQWLAIMTAFHLSEPNESRAAVGLLIAVHLCAAVAGACVPMWGARWIGKWQILPPGDNARQQFTLRNALALVGLACFMLALGRVVLTSPVEQAAPIIPFWIFASAIATAVVFACVSTLVVMGGLHPFFVSDEFDFALTLVGVPVCAFAVTLLLSSVLLLLLQATAPEVLIAIFGFTLGQFSTVAITMFWLRRSGFILNRGQNRTTPGNAGDEPDGPSADLTTPGLPPLHPLNHL